MKKRFLSLLLATLLTLCFTIPAVADDITSPVSLTLDGSGMIIKIKVINDVYVASYTIPSSYNGTSIRGISSDCSTTGSFGTFFVPDGLRLESGSLSGIDANSITLEYGRSSLPDRLFAGNSYVISISIPSSIYSIGASAFANCTSLISASLPDGISQIPDSCFSGCSRLSSISIPDNVINIGDSAFSGCSSLKSVDFNTKLRTIDNYAFADCTSLEDITTDDTATFPSVYTIGRNAFAYTAITRLVLPDTVTSLDVSSFEKCDQLTELYIGSGISTIPAMCFNGCRNLYTLSLGNTVTRIEKDAFSYCFSHDRYAAQVTLPVSLAYIGATAFEGCSYIDYIAIYNNNCEISSNAFYKCGSFTLKGYNGSTAEQFCKSTATTNIKFQSLTGGSGDGGSDSKYDDLRYVIQNGEVHITAYLGSNNDRVDIPATINGKPVTVIAANAFLRSDVVTVVLPAGIHTIGERAFAGCSKLASVTILDSCRNIEGSAFADTPSTLVIRGLRNSYVQAYASNQKITFNALSTDEYKCLSGTHGTTRTERKEATCKEEGYERVICTVCSKIIKETVLAKPSSHKYVTTTVEPTCTEKGYVLHTCEYCKDSYRDNEKPATGHKWDEWQVILKPTYTTNGTRTRHCSNKNCTETQVETIPMLTLASFDELVDALPTDELKVIERDDNGKKIKLFCGFTEKNDVSKYTELFDPQYNVQIVNAKGVQKTSGYIATGDKFTLKNANGDVIDSLTVVVTGDMTGDGRINAADYIMQRRVILRMITTSADKYAAGDINGNGNIQPNDYIKLRRYILGMLTTLE